MLVPYKNKDKMPERCTTEACDADKHAQNLTNWQQEYDQISGGAFYGRLDELTLPQVQLFKEHTSQALRQQCKVWSEGLWLGIPAVKGRGSSRINGQTIGSSDIFYHPGGCDFELVTPATFEVFGMVVDRRALAENAEMQGVELWEAGALQCPRLGIPEKTLAAIRLLLDRFLSGDFFPTAPPLQQDFVMTALSELLQQENPNQKVIPSYRHRKTVVDRVKQHIDQHNDVPVTMTELCALTNVSRRTLQYSFESIIGISPLQFLRLTRLNRVRRALCRSDQSIADTAAYWGFWHGGQFAKDYRQLFGESPSETRQKYSDTSARH